MLCDGAALSFTLLFLGHKDSTRKTEEGKEEKGVKTPRSGLGFDSWSVGPALVVARHCWWLVLRACSRFANLSRQRRNLSSDNGRRFCEPVFIVFYFIYAFLKKNYLFIYPAKRQALGRSQDLRGARRRRRKSERVKPEQPLLSSSSSFVKHVFLLVTQANENSYL